MKYLLVYTDRYNMSGAMMLFSSEEQMNTFIRSDTCYSISAKYRIEKFQ